MGLDNTKVLAVPWNKNTFLKRGLLGILRAAIYGALLFDGFILVNNLAYKVWGDGSGLLADVNTSLI